MAFLAYLIFLIFSCEFIDSRTYSCTCGRNSQNQRIVGGVEARPNSYLWIAALSTDDLSEIVCGGSLINNRYILTAAHCLVQFKEDEIKIALGAHSKSNLETTSDIYDSEKFIVHEKYKSSDPFQLNDIGLIRLSKEVVFTNKVQPICLPNSDEKQIFKYLSVAGWGKTSEDGEPSNLLNEVKVKYIGLKKCISLYNSNIITKNHICAGDNLKDSCYGDSGGPLSYFNQSEVAIQVGIVSWGIECAASRPGVYTKVESYLDWISENTKDSLQCS